MSEAAAPVSLATARRLAEKVAAALEPACERVMIVGSVRREKPSVGDIDLLVVKRRDAGLFGEPAGSPADALLLGWAADGRILPRRGVKPGWAHASFTVPAAPELPIELYACDPDNWGLWCAIRTGPPCLSRQLVTPMGVRTHEGEPGLVPLNLTTPMDGFRLRRKSILTWGHPDEAGVPGEAGELCPTPEEADVWRLYGLPDVDPPERGLYQVPAWSSHRMTG